MIDKIVGIKRIIYPFLTIISVTLVGYEVASSTGIVKLIGNRTQIAQYEAVSPTPEINSSLQQQITSVANNPKSQKVLGKTSNQQVSRPQSPIPPQQQLPQQNTQNPSVNVNVVQKNENINQNYNQNTNINQAKQTNTMTSPEPTSTPIPTTPPAPQTKEITFAENRPQPFNSPWIEVSGYSTIAIDVSITGSIVQYAAHYTNDAASATDYTGFVEQTRINCGSGTACPRATLPILGKYYRISTGTANGNVTAKAVLFNR